MKLSDILMLVSNELEINLFKEKIKPEILEYKRLLKKKGGSTPIHLVEDVILYFKNSDFAMLCDLYLKNYLDKYEISYLADAISLSSTINFEDEKILDALNEFCMYDLNDIELKKIVLKYKNLVIG